MPTSPQCLSPEALQRLSAGLLAPVEATRFQQHLDRCERCREAFNALGAQPSVVIDSTAALKTEQSGSSDAIDLGTLSLNKATKLENLKSLGPYRIVRMLGKGGMGAVFEAEDPRLKRRVALKVMLPILAVDPISRQRFLREAEAMGALEHDNIISVYMADEDQGIPFLAMPLLKGETLADRIHRDKGPLPLPDMLRIAREIALGLSASHAVNFVHRDIKPANVWLEAGTGRVKLLDFGLSRAVNDAHLTKTGNIAGTPSYMAPEQAEGHEVDHRADLFSLGCVLYHMATGRLAFSGKTPYEILWQVSKEMPRPPQQLNPALPLHLVRLIGLLLAKKPSERPASALVVARMLETIQAQAVAVAIPLATPVQTAPRAERAVIGEPVVLAPRPLIVTNPLEKLIPPPRRHKPGSRRRGMVACAAGLLLVCLLVGMGIKVAQVFDEKDSSPVPKEVESRAPAPPPVENVVIKEDPFIWPQGMPLFTSSIVQRPGPMKGLASWTLMTRGHESAITGVAYRPDGLRYASVDLDGMVHVWDAPTGNLAVVMPAQPAGDSGHHDIDWSPDGRYLASGGPDGSIRLWDTVSVHLLQVLRGHNGGVTGVAWSPDGRLLASGSWDKSVRVWDVVKGRLLKTLSGHEKGVWDVRWSADGTLLASCSVDGTIRIWSMKSASPLHILKGHLGAVRRVAWSSKNPLVASVGDDMTVKVWNAESGTLHQTLLGHEHHIDSIVWSRDGERVFSGSWDNSIRVWNASTGTLDRTIFTDGIIYPMKNSPEGNVLLVGFRDGRVQQRNIKSGEILCESKGKRPNYVNGVSWSPDGTQIACPHEDGNVTIWRADSGQRLRTLSGLSQWANSTSWSPDGKHLAACYGASSKIQVWDIEAGWMSKSLEGPPEGYFDCVAWSPDSTTLASAGKDGMVRLWDGASGKCTSTLEGHQGIVHGVAWSVDGKRLASSSHDGTVRIWDAITWKSLGVLDAGAGFVMAVGWSPDGKVITAGYQDGAVRLWAAETSNLQQTLHGQGGLVRTIAWGPDGKTLVSFGYDAGVEFWDLQSGKSKIRLTGPSFALGGSWSSDGKTLVAGSGEGHLTFWDPEGHLRATLEASTDGPFATVSADGHYNCSERDANDLFVVVALTDAGEYRTLSVKDFATQYGWKNDPMKVQPLARQAKVVGP